MSVITNIDKDHLENHKNSFDVLKKTLKNLLITYHSMDYVY